MSRLGDKNHRHDSFHKRAKQAGFVARSVFKLEELDKRCRLFKPGQRVLDLGCRPGSWLQYAGSVIGPRGAMVGVDRQDLDRPIAGARIVVGDVFELDGRALLGDLTAFDVVMSDMAPDTSGVRSLDQARSENLFERALDLGLELLAPGGHFVAKLFMGPDFQRLQKRVREGFEQVKTVKPEGSRKESIEQYVVGLRRR